MADSYKPAPLDATRVATKPQRVLACQLCQQRKVKCDRKFPCTNCVRGKAQCVPATLLPRQRRRRFPERELLARIRHYEDVLQQHKIKFDPLHPPASAGTPAESPAESPETLVDPGTPDTTRTDVSGQDKATRPRAINLWDAVNHKTVESEDEDEDDDEFDNGHDLRVSILRTTWDRAFRDGSETNYHLLFGSPARNVDLAPLHPDQGKIFRLWQIYLDNVNPLLKVTHVPTLQARIVDAVGDLSNISASLEALLFGIYCVAILSISDDQCRTLFGSPKKEVLSGYQFACRQALVNCNILQSSDRDALTALFLNLISVRLDTDPRSLSSILAVAIRLAQGMGYHNEANNAKAPPLEAEMRRRLWWALVVFDNRICEMLNYKTASLAPTWTCGTPLNLNDFELLPETKTLPPVSDRPTEALFVVLRSQLSDFIRHCAFHLDFIDPLLSTLAAAKTAAATGGPPPGARELLDLQRRIEDHTLALCDPANPLHFMTLWTTRGYIARSLLLEHCSRHAASSSTPSDPLPDPATGLTHALRMLECDTHLMTSPLTQGYRWHAHFHFPFLAYTFIVQHLRKRRDSTPPERVDAAWEAMSANFEAHALDAVAKGTREGDGYEESPFYVLFSRVVLRAWEGMGVEEDQEGGGGGGGKKGGRKKVPRIVERIRAGMERMRAREKEREREGGGGGGGVGGEMGQPQSGLPPAADVPMMGVVGEGAGAQTFVSPASGGYLDMLAGDAGMEFMDTGDVGQFWPTMDWGMMQRRRW